MSAVLQYLEAQAAAHPQDAQFYQAVKGLHQQKLWFQLGEKLVQDARNIGSLQQLAAMQAFWDSVVQREFAELQPLAVAKCALMVSRHMPEPQEAVDFLEQVAQQFTDRIEKAVDKEFGHKIKPAAAAAAVSQDDAKMQDDEEAKQQSNGGEDHRWRREGPLPRASADDEQACLLVLLETARLRSSMGSAETLDAAKDLLYDLKDRMDAYLGVLDPSVHASYYLASSSLFKAQANSAKYFHHSLLYLTYTPLESLRPQEQLALAHDLSLAAIFGQGIYNFGELLHNPILKGLSEHPESAWIVEMLSSMSVGDIDRYQRAREDALRVAKPEDRELLAAHTEMLDAKVRILALVDMVFGLSADKRTITFQQVSERCRLKDGQTEFLLLKAFAHGVVEGVIDEVEQTVRIKRIQPRVLNQEQLVTVRDRMKEWSEKVGQMAEFMEKNAPELLASAESRMAGIGM